MDRVKGKVALVTGGGSGFGKAICELLAEEGARVIVSDIDLAAAEETVKSIVAVGGEAIAVMLDVVSEEGWEKAMDITLTHFDQLNVLVNNAGIHIAGDFTGLSLADWQKTMNVNLDGAFLGMRSAVNVMKGNKDSSSIINIASVGAFVGGDYASYSASKGGMRMLSKSSAVECGKMGFDIRVNTIFPGAIDGGMGRRIERSQEFIKAFLSMVPLGRVGKSKDIAQGVLFLASDESNFVSGSELVIDGGMTLGCGIGLLNRMYP